MTVCINDDRITIKVIVFLMASANRGRAGRPAAPAVAPPGELNLALLISETDFDIAAAGGNAVTFKTRRNRRPTLLPL
jgi:hypothetical protein